MSASFFPKTSHVFCETKTEKKKKSAKNRFSFSWYFHYNRRKNLQINSYINIKEFKVKHMFFYFIPITSHHWVKLVFQRHTKQFKTENVVVILIYQRNEECIEVVIGFVT